LSATGHVERFTKNIFSLRTAMIGVAGAAAMGAMVKKSLDTADAIGKAADSIGISTDALQEYRHAARISGVETASLDKSIQQFAKRVGEAKAGTGAMITYLKKFDEQLLSNIQKSKSTDEALDLVFKRMGQTASATDKAALANAAFGRSGITMVNMVKDGAEGLIRLRQEARDLGIVMDEQLIRQSEKANDELEKLTRVIKVQFMSAAVGLAPEIAKIAKHTTDWWKANQEVVKQDVVGWVKGVTEAVRIGIKPLQAWADLWKRIGYKVGGGSAVRGMDYKSGIIKPIPVESEPTPTPKLIPPPIMDTGAADAAKKEYEALMKEVAKAQEEFQKSLIIPSGTGAMVEEQLRRGVGEYVIGYDRTKEDIDKTRQAFEEMFSDLRFQSEDYYEYRKAQLEKQAKDYEKYSGDTVLAHQWLTEQIKALDQERSEAAGNSNQYLIDLSQRTAEAMEQNFSDYYFDVMRGEFDDLGDYANAMLKSIQRATADVMGQMTKEALFGKGSSGGGLISGIGNWLGGLFGGGRQHGGSVDPYKTYLVGEKGPELLYMGSKGGRVIPSRQTALAPSIQVNVINETGEQMTARQGSIRFDGQKYVAEVHIDKMINSRSYRQANRQAMR